MATYTQAITLNINSMILNIMNNLIKKLNAIVIILQVSMTWLRLSGIIVRDRVW